jgi:hypothetical protein
VAAVLENGKPKRKDAWKPRYRADLKQWQYLVVKKKKRGQGLTRPGPLYPLLAPLAGVNEDTLKSWFDREAGQVSTKPHAPDDIRGFLRWCCTPP